MTWPSPPLLSELTFGACLSYTSRPEPDSDAQKLAKVVCHQIKVDGRVNQAPVIPLAVQRLKENLTPELDDLLARDVLLVPAPGSAPRKGGTLWVPERICQELVSAGFGRSVEPLLSRLTPVAKSSFAAPGQRPTAQRHYETMGVNRRLGVDPLRITIVDDVITKGATLLAAASLLEQAYPEATIQAFALVRTVYSEDFEGIVDPLTGTIYWNGTYPRRVP
jgi:predicted amidophosphoribosyltransferase